MASPDGKGYLIPPDAQPEEMGCILVFYPEDAKNFYLRALLGSLSYLGTWTAWERDTEHRGLLAAKAWKDANDCTFDSMSCITDLVTVLQEIRDAIANQQLTVNVDNSDMVTAIVGVQTAIENQSINLDAGELLPALTGIQTAIENQELTCNCGAGSSEEDMPIVINNCCCCGGGGNSGNPDTTLPPEIPPDYNPPIPMPDPTEPEPENDPMSIHKCAYAHYMVVKWRNTCVAVGDGSITATNLIEKLQQTFNDSGTPINWSVSDWSDLWVYLGLYLAGVFGYSQQIANEIDSKLEAIKCAILQETSADQKKAQVATLIDVMGLPQTVKLFMKQVFNLLPLGSMYGGYIETGAVVPSWAYVPGCPGCINLPEEENEPEPSSLYLRDHTSTQGQLWVSDHDGGYSQVGYSSGLAFDFYREYWVMGDAAGHCDCEITAASNSSNRVECMVRIWNMNLAPIAVGIVQLGTPGTAVIAAGQYQDVRTSVIDFSPNITEPRIKVRISPLSS